MPIAPYSYSKLTYIDVPHHGDCLSGIHAMLYAKWSTGANYVGLRGNVLIYEIYGCPENRVEPVWRNEHGWLYPIKEIC